MPEYLRNLRSKVGHDLVLLPGVSAIVRDSEGRILLVRNADDNLWTLPGGIVEPDESPKDATVREMQEETGLLVDPVRIFGVYGGPQFRVTYPNGDVVSFVSTVFECKVVSGAMAPDHEETLDVRYFAGVEVNSLKTQDWVRMILRDALNQASLGDSLHI
jgi:ADP-ribose pyrophosphatase YjhB (NUDIX family)